LIGIAVIGAGYWGINYVRVFNELPRSRVVAVCDPNEERLRHVQRLHAGISALTRWEDALAHAGVDAVVVATPAATHFDIARQALTLGKHVLIEKPLTHRRDLAIELQHVASTSQAIAMVGHTFLFNAGVRKVKQLTSEPGFGHIHYLHATRTNLGPIRKDVDALWDLGAHDVSIANYIIGRPVQWVSAVGARPLQDVQADVAFATLHYGEEVIANLHVSWIDPNKVREIVVVADKCRIVFDDLKSSEPVRIFEKGVSPHRDAATFGEFRLLIRDGDIISPRIEPSEPLKVQCAEFLECVEARRQPFSGVQFGAEVVAVLEALSRSVEQRGAPVAVEPVPALSLP
jgi:predicted dehydrogenase